jgi:two-component system, chemotaxis family, response regulator WspF
VQKTVIKVAIANDTLMALEALRRAIATNSNYELIWTAKNGSEAIVQAKRDRPDLILMDLLMPEIDGVEATRQIMLRSPCAILIVTGSVRRNTSKVFEAMGCGALDVVQTPVLINSQPMVDAAQPLLNKMATVTKLIGKSPAGQRRRTVATADSRGDSVPLIVIGASTGGPKAVSTILSQLPSSLKAAIVIVQHIDAQFAAGLADWLQSQANCPVRLAKAGDALHPGQVILAGAHQHLMMTRDRTLTYGSSTGYSPYCPSVDVFFKSVAVHWPSPGKAVLLTGMGRDGAQGLSELRAAGWETIAESEQSCVVYGMPRAAIALGAAKQVLCSLDIANALCQD